MKLVNYKRVPILYAEDLPNEAFHEFESWYGERTCEMQFIQDPTDESNYLNVGDFLRYPESKLWHGYYSIHYFAAYFIRINNTGDEAIVCLRTSLE